MAKKKRTLSEEQKKKMAEGRARAKAKRDAEKKPPVQAVRQDDEPEFEPTEVKEAKAAEAEAAKTLAEPPLTDEIEDAPEPLVAPVNPPHLATPKVDPNLIATIVATVQSMQQQNPQAVAAKPEQKLEEVARLTGNEARVGAKGVQGIVFKYPVERDWYADPTDRLLSEPSLARFAMKENYLFRWAVDGETYEKNGVTFSEPRFTLELFRRLYNEGGQQTGRMALVARHMQMEDEMTTRLIAQQEGLLDKFPEGEEGFRQLMTEARYFRMRRWLLDLFTPAKIRTHRKRPTTEVIAGKVVEVYDTEELTDKETAVSQTSSLKTETGIGGIETPGDK